MEVLGKIIEKAQKEKHYGHLLKAELKNVLSVTAVTPDSLAPEVARLVEQEKAAAHDPLLAAVYQSVLGNVYRNNPSLDEHSEDLSKEYFRKSVSNPSLLAGHRVTEFEPLMVNGFDSKYFNNDLLHVLGMEAGDYQMLHDYYEQAGSQEATCLMACELQRRKRKMSDRYASHSLYLQQVDSLIRKYEHLETAPELVLLRYEYMEDAKDIDAGQKLKYIDESLGKWGSSKRLNKLRNARKQLTCPMYNISFGCLVSQPGKEHVVSIAEARNIKWLRMTVSRVNLTGERDYNIGYDGDYKIVKKAVVKGSEQVFECQFTGKEDYEIAHDSLVIPPLPVGMYLVEFQADRKEVSTDKLLYYVSDVYVLSEPLPDRKTRFAVVSATTGQPISKANLQLDLNYRWGKKDKGKIKTLTCDSKGEVVYQFQNDDYRGNYNIFAYTANDKFCPNQDLWSSFSSASIPSDRTRAYLYTDRSIYRPGQTVHAAVVMFLNEAGLKTTAVAGKTINMRLRDANYKEVGNVQVTTDEYGKAAADFVLPDNGLTGVFTLTCDNARHQVSIHVEEYKRPTFEVEIPRVEQEYRAGDIVEVTGFAKTYAGVPVQGAKVAYSVCRKQASWWWARSGNEEMLVEDTVETDSEGAFRMRVPLIMPDDYDPDASTYRRSAFYNFDIRALVTDLGGESHEGSLSLPLGSKPTVLSCHIPGQFIADSIKTISFGYRNAAGADVDAMVTYTIDRQERTYQAQSNTPVDFRQIARSLNSGEHVIKAICGNDTVEQKFIVFSLNDKRPCVETHDWYYVSDSSFPKDGKPVYLQVGTSDEKTHVVYTIIAGNKVLESGTFQLSNAIKTYKLTYKEQYESGLLLTFAWVKDGKAYTHQASIRRPLPDKRIHLKWTTFRDRLTPGQQEEWTLQATKPDGTPAEVSLVAAMYDKSLDQIYSHDWSFSPEITAPMPYTFWRSLNFVDISASGHEYMPMASVPSLLYSRFDNELFSFWNARAYFHMGDRQLRRMAKAESNVLAEVPLEMNVADVKMDAEAKAMEESMDADTADNLASGGEVDKRENQGESVQMRENMSETAFFYPTLVSDAQGNIAIKFTLPESVTTWRMMGLATDREMNYGEIDAETVAKKDVMIQPNMPRFVRKGDKARISARIFNTSEKDIRGTAEMSLIDPVDEHVVYVKSVPYEVAVGQTASVAFDYTPEKDGTLLVCRMTAKGDGFSDGEQHYLPVLPSMELVTRTYPFTQNGPQTTQVNLRKLFPDGISDGKLTVEYTNNPAWLMIQTLPTVGLTNSDNAISLAASYYANSLANYLIHLSPDVKATIDSWRQEAGTENSMMSNLAKNEELKDLLLNETPWVGDADNEESQKRSLVKFFDETTIEMRLTMAIDKLRKLQHGNGSWSWWPGMEGNRYMTVAVSEMLVRLNQMIGQQENVSDMLEKALDFIGQEQVEEELMMRKLEKKNHRVMPSETALRTLYIFALDGRKLPEKVNRANNYMVEKLASKPSEFTIYGKANSAVILAAYGKKQKALEYLMSLREYSVMTEEMGRYFDTRKAKYAWFSYAIPTEVAAIEAIKRLQPEDGKTVDEMRRWLLQEKRTQAWSTPINTVDAVYAFLEGHVGELDQKVETVLAVDGQQLSLPQSTAGIGYIKTSMQVEKPKTFEAQKTSDGTSWGALYAQFMQPSKEVENSASGITVTREIRSEKKELHVGDKVKVRITIKADRDYDFVEVIDRRAACMEPVSQLSGYHYGYYVAPKDYTTCYYFDKFGKGTHVLETEYYIDREGTYDTGTCKVQCAYSPEYTATGKAFTVIVKP